MIATPWGFVVIGAAVPLLVAGLALLAALLFLASRQHPVKERFFRKATVVAGLVVMGGAFVSVAFPFMSQRQNMERNLNYSPEIFTIPWTQLVIAATHPLLVLGLAILVVVLVIGPLHEWVNAETESGQVGAALRGRSSATVAFSAGILLAGAGVLALFAPRIFASSMAPTKIEMDGSYLSLQAWPTVLVDVAPPVLLVGFLTLMGGALILISSRNALPRAAYEDAAA
ncbi:hypothetical protein [Arthrobacter sp. GMC3]|uniref:hypothetical protein n=1 Tax=Arthrobacter sp. GMC3 TaxID=2058894 RepID=UPI0015E3178F|nr:hypothetical protein [Arthrobacter sp. GMC3]